MKKWWIICLNFTRIISANRTFTNLVAGVTLEQQVAVLSTKFSIRVFIEH